jgi:hypothetical protein
MKNKTKEATLAIAGVAILFSLTIGNGLLHNYWKKECISKGRVWSKPSSHSFGHCVSKEKP